MNCPQNEINKAINRSEDIQNLEFSKTIGATIQLKPQKYKIFLKPNSQVVIPIYFQRAEDYPMDLYYLMDLSYTMLAHKEELAKVGQKIAASIENTTNDFRIGFGSFVDKPQIPYTFYNNRLSISCLY
jgi:protocadherin alpha